VLFKGGGRDGVVVGEGCEEGWRQGGENKEDESDLQEVSVGGGRGQREDLGLMLPSMDGLGEARVEVWFTLDGGWKETSDDWLCS